MEKFPKDKFSKYKEAYWGLLDYDDAVEEIGAFAVSIRERYPNYDEYAMWHVLGSGVDEDMRKIKYDDFPGEDSIESFLDGLVNKYFS